MSRGRPRLHGLKTDFGRRIWPWLVRLGLDHVPTLAKHIGVAPSTVNRSFYETEQPQRKVLVGLRRLGIPAEVLIPDPSPKPPGKATVRSPSPLDAEELELLHLLRSLSPEARFSLLELARHFRPTGPAKRNRK